MPLPLQQDDELLHRLLRPRGLSSKVLSFNSWNKIKGNRTLLSVTHLRSQFQISALACPGEPIHMRDLPVQSDSDGSACAGPGQQSQQQQMQDTVIPWKPLGQTRDAV